MGLTVHIGAQKGDIARHVLMPGDPLRAQFIAHNFLTSAKLVSSVRNVLMFTGTYKGKRVSVCASGMGQPSIGIYSYELFKFFDVQTIIRVGSSGSYVETLKVYDVVLAQSAYSDHATFNENFMHDKSHITYPDPKLNDFIMQTAQDLKLPIKNTRIHSADVFYSTSTPEENAHRTGASCVEMESGALFPIAKSLNRSATTILTISDTLVGHKEEIDAQAREKNLRQAMELALESLLKLD